MSALALQSFGFGGQLVRVIDREGVAWFVANDVCAALEIGNSRQAVARLEEDERDAVITNDAIGRSQEMTVVSESGVYALIFSSRKAAAKKFRVWVTSEVLPTIRRTGRYEIAPQDNDEPESGTLFPDQFAERRQKLAELKEIRLVLGPKAARRAWLKSGLLDDEVVIPDHDLIPVGVMKSMHRSVADWMDARTEAVAGWREASNALHNDYISWARGQGLTGPEILSFIAFGKVLTNCGVGNVKAGDGRRARVGLRLISEARTAA